MNAKEMLEQAGFSFFIFFTLFVFLSKSATNILGGILLLLSLIYMSSWPDLGLIRKKRIMFIWLLPLVIGFVISFFSFYGPKGVLGFLERYRFFLLVLPFVFFVNSEKKIGVLFVVLNISAMIGALYGYINFRYSEVNIWDGFIGFHPCGRNSDLMMSMSLVNVAVLFGYCWPNNKMNIINKSMIIINTVLLLGVVLILGRRASYIGFMIGTLLIIMFFRKKIAVIFCIIAILSSILLGNTWIIDRMKSVFDKANNVSNVARLQLYKTGCDYLIDRGMIFRGTGAKKSEKIFANYYIGKSDEYKTKYSIVPKYFGEFHSSYLQMAVEDGVFFLFSFIICFIYIFMMIIIEFRNLDGNLKVYSLAAIGLSSGFLFSQIFHNDLYSYGGIPFILVLLSRLYVAAEWSIANNDNKQEILE